MNINRLRIDRACYEMAVNKMNVTEAACECGFNELSIFQISSRNIRECPRDSTGNALCYSDIAFGIDFEKKGIRYVCYFNWNAVLR